MIKLEAIGIAPLAKEKLDHQKKLSIHSRFENSLNLLSGEDLIYIGERALPIGLQIKNYQMIKNAEDVHYKQSHLVFITSDSKYSIQVDELSIIDDRHQGELSCLKQKLNRLQEVVELKSLKDLTYYLGRGQGLTPSGDDFLVGLYCVSFCDQGLAKKMRVLRSVDFKKFTTSISAAYLEAARSGHFNPDLIELLKTKNSSQFENKVSTILEIGHRSGMDTLEGVLLGLSLMEKEGHDQYENSNSVRW